MYLKTPGTIDATIDGLKRLISNADTMINSWPVKQPGYIADAKNRYLQWVEWDGLIGLSTDVVLRTTDYQGSLTAELYDLSCGWIFARPPEPDDSDFMFEPGLDVGEDFEAALFMAAHGWYRQALGTLRSAVETLTIAAGFAVRQDSRRYQDWRDGKHEPKFGNGRDFLAQAVSLKPAEQALGGAGLFGHDPAGVLQTVYEELCPYVHSAKRCRKCGSK